jgi:hypothetical protein
LPDTDAIIPETRSLPLAACGVGVAGVGVAVVELELVGGVTELFDAAGAGLLEEPHAATESAVAAVIARMVYRMRFKVRGESVGAL